MRLSDRAHDKIHLVDLFYYEEKTMKEYNGHRSWNAWNVSLWINNDESLYTHAYNLVKEHGVKEATNIFYKNFQGEKTQDGAIYNKTCIRLALQDILE